MRFSSNLLLTRNSSFNNETNILCGFKFNPYKDYSHLNVDSNAIDVAKKLKKVSYIKGKQFLNN